MFDLGKQKVDVKCSCGRKHNVSLQEVSNKKIIKCDCGVNIQLNDNNGSVKKGVSNVNKSIKDLENMFKKIGR